MLEFVSVLRRLVGGDVKAAPTAGDRVLIVDSADLDKVKTARLGDLPTSAADMPFSQLMNVQEDGLLRFPLGKPCRGYHLRGNVKDITLPPVAETLIINDSTGDPDFGSTVIVRPGEGPGPFNSPEVNFPRQFVTGEPTYRLGVGDKVTFITDDEGEPRIFILLHN